MERHKSALKAARQAIKHQKRNQEVISSCRTAVKKLRTAITSKDKAAKETVPALLKEVQSKLMKAASKQVIHTKTASRQIARLSAAASKA